MSDDKLWKSSERGSESALGPPTLYFYARPSSRTRSLLTQEHETYACSNKIGVVSLIFVDKRKVRPRDRSPRFTCLSSAAGADWFTRVDERWCTYVRVSYILHIQHPPLSRRELLQRCLRNEIRPGESFKSSNGSSHPSTRASWRRRFGGVCLYSNPSLNLHEFHEIFVTLR